MTPTVNETTNGFLAARSVHELSTSAGLVVFALLMAVLLAKEVLRAAGVDSLEARLRILDVAAVPLLASLVAVVIARFWVVL